MTFLQKAIGYLKDKVTFDFPLSRISTGERTCASECPSVECLKKKLAKSVMVMCSQLDGIKRIWGLIHSLVSTFPMSAQCKVQQHIINKIMSSLSVCRVRRSQRIPICGQCYSFPWYTFWPFWYLCMLNKKDWNEKSQSAC